MQEGAGGCGDCRGGGSAGSLSGASGRKGELGGRPRRGGDRLGRSTKILWGLCLFSQLSFPEHPLHARHCPEPRGRNSDLDKLLPS